MRRAAYLTQSADYSRKSSDNEIAGQVNLACSPAENYSEFDGWFAHDGRFRPTIEGNVRLLSQDRQQPASAEVLVLYQGRLAAQPPIVWKAP